MNQIETPSSPTLKRSRENANLDFTSNDSQIIPTSNEENDSTTITNQQTMSEAQTIPDQNIIQSNQIPLNYQDRIEAVSSLLQTLNSSISGKSVSICDITILCFPLFLSFESWIFFKDIKRYKLLVQRTQKKLNEVLKTIDFSISTPKIVYERILPLFHYYIQDLPSNNVVEIQKVKRRKLEDNNSKIQTCKTESSFEMFSFLPPEIQYSIINFLGNENWKTGTQVSKTFRHMFHETRKELDLWEQENVQPEQLIRMMNDCYNLKKMSFPSKLEVGDQELLSIPEKVEEIRIGKFSKISPEGIKKLSQLNLKSVSLSGFQVDKALLEGIFINEKNRKWKEIRLENVFIDPKDLIHILQQIDVSELKALDLIGLDLNVHEIKNVLELKNLNLSLEEINLSGSPLTSELIIQMVKLFGNNLRSLKLVGCLIDHNDVKMIGDSCPNLEELDISYSRANPSCSTFEKITKLKKLKKIHLRGWNIVEGHLNYLLNNLSELEIVDVRLCAGMNGVKEESFIEGDENYGRCESLKRVLIEEDLNNIMTKQVEDLLNSCKKIHIGPLCRLFFPPFSRVQHAPEFMKMLKNKCKLVNIFGKRYLISKT